MKDEEVKAVQWAFDAMRPFMDNLPTPFTKEVLAFNLAKHALIERAKSIVPMEKMGPDFESVFAGVCLEFARRVAGLPSILQEMIEAEDKKANCTCVACVLRRVLGATEKTVAKEGVRY